MERVAAGQYSVWVQDPADGTKMVQLPAPEPGTPTFVTFELTDTALAGSVGEADGNFTQLPGEPAAFDGPAALLAGYWRGQQCDPADARIHELRAYRAWSEAQIERRPRRVGGPVPECMKDPLMTDADQLLALATRLNKAATEISKQTTEVHDVADELAAMAENGGVEPPDPEPPGDGAYPT